MRKTITREQLTSGQFKYTDADIDITGPRVAPVHPGTILYDEFMAVASPQPISAYRLAIDIRVPANRITKLTKGERGITADTALRLGRYFGNSASFWMQLQAMYDLAMATRDHGMQIAREVQHRIVA